MVGFPLAAEIQLLVQILITSRTENIVGPLFSLLPDELRFLICEIEFALRYLGCLLFQ